MRISHGSGVTLALAGLMAFGVPAALAEMSLTSSDITDGGPLSERHVYVGFGCEGENLSPSLSWTGAPAETKSYIVTMYDPDAPTGSGWWHWTLFNIPAEVTHLDTGIGVNAPVPEGAGQGRTDFGSVGFGGVCPPVGHGPHRYIFTVYAMPDAALSLDENASGALVGYFALSQALDSANLTATYER